MRSTSTFSDSIHRLRDALAISCARRGAAQALHALCEATAHMARLHGKSPR